MSVPVPPPPARTKFAPPRVRDDAIARERLLADVRESVMSRRVTLISAAAGFGKTTLLSQLAKSPGIRIAWVSIEDQDNAAQEFMGSLCAAIGIEAATTPAAIVNALCDAGDERVVIVLDDLHRVIDEAALAALAQLVERLPHHVGVVLASRTVPALPLARLRASGELAEFRPQEMRFSGEEARAFFDRRLRVPAACADLERLVAESEGWPAALAMMAEALNMGDSAAGVADRAHHAGSRRLVFEFLAQEVLDALPPELRDFALRCSVLPDLSPALCAELSGRADAAALLDQLYAQNVFVSRIDENGPVMRFHDLFREFLQQQLARADASLPQALHAQAARAENDPVRAIAHWVAAESWAEAAQAIVRHGQRVPHLISNSAIPSLVRMTAMLPAHERDDNPGIQLMLASFAFMHWQTRTADHHYARAMELFERAGDDAGAAQAAFLRVMVLVSLSRFDEARRLYADSLRRLPPHDELRAIAPLFALWLEASSGHVARCGERFADLAAMAHSAQAPNLFSRIVPGGQFQLMLGIPGAAPAIRDFALALLAYARQQGDRPREATAILLLACHDLWTGRIADAQRHLALSRTLMQRATPAAGLAFSTLQLDVLLSARDGDAVAAAACIEQELPRMLAGMALVPTHSVFYVFLGVRVYWLLGDVERTQQACERLMLSPPDGEWPYMRAIRLLAQGYVALQQRDLERAHEVLSSSAHIASTLPLVSFGAQPSAPLAYTLLMQGDADGAWDVWRPHAVRAVEGDELGLLLLENHEIVCALLGMKPANVEDMRLLDQLRQRYRVAIGKPQESPAPPGPFSSLTSRELQILQMVAAGASNKQIANELFLSLHTVKRHVANIIGKLAVETRGQAAAMYHGTPATA
jgi:LuxR family maltose regulon positive regulatory protein